MGVSVGGQKQTQSQQQMVDPTTAYWMKQIWGAGQAAGNAGPGELLNGAGQYGSFAQGQGNLGLSALGGNQGAVGQLMNPYIQNVVDQNNQSWQHINQQTQNQLGDAAQRAGAFGGSRHGVAEGVALAQNNLSQAQQNAGLYSQGYDQAVNQAGQLAGLGFQGAGLASNLGLQGVGSPDLWRLNMLKQGFLGPLGGYSSGKSSGTSAQAGFGVG